MELNDLKDTWAQYDKRLSKALKLNEELLKSINLEKHTHALKTPMFLGLLNIVIQAFMISLIVAYTIRLSEETIYLVFGLTSFSMCTLSLIFSAVKVYRFNELSYYHLDIAHFQKKLTQLRIFIMYLRKIDYIIAGIIGITLTPLILKAVADIDLLKNLTIIVPAIFFVLVLGFTIGICLNLMFYDKNIREAESFLKLINEFDKEE